MLNNSFTPDEANFVKLWFSMILRHHSPMAVNTIPLSAEVSAIGIKKILKTGSMLPIFTIHDSIATIKGEEDYIKQIIEEETFQLLGNKPQLSIDLWEV